MPTRLIQEPNSVKTVTKQCQYRHIRASASQPLQQIDELHQKDLRINQYLVHILGMALRHVSKGGHLSGLIPNRRLFGVPAVINPPTCRYSSHNAV